MSDIIKNPVQDIIVPQVAESGGGGGDGTGFDVPLFVARAQTGYTTATSDTVSIPGDATSGDLLVLFVMHRDTLTAPADDGSPWTLRGSQTETASGFDQTVTIMTATYDGIITDITATQATSQRISVGVAVFKSDSGFSFGTAVERLEANNGNNNGTGDYTWTGISNDLTSPAIVFVATSWPIMPTTMSATINSRVCAAPYGTNSVSHPFISDNRMIAFYKYVEATTSTGSMISGCVTAETNVDAIVTAAVPIAKG